MRYLVFFAGTHSPIFHSAKLDEIFEAGLLKEDYIVNLSDYEGSLSAFAARSQSVQATLDSFCAVLDSSNFTGIAKNPDIAMWGYFGHSIPASNPSKAITALFDVIGSVPSLTTTDWWRSIAIIT
jgi:hypothetical protein